MSQATNSKIVLDFNDPVYYGNTIEFERVNSQGVVKTIKEQWVQTRTSAGLVSMSGFTTEMDMITAVLRFIYYFNLDYNTTGLYTVTHDGFGKVTIEINNEWTFQNYTGNAATLSNIVNGSPQSYQIVGYSFTPHATDKCNKVELQMETTEPTAIIVEGTLNHLIQPADTSFSISLSRNTNINKLILKNNNNPSDTIVFEDYIYIRKLLKDNLFVIVTSTPSGATVVLDMRFPNQLTSNPDLQLEYSIDGVTWQSSNSFTGQAEGNYTAYVRDVFGCSISKDYSVDARENPEPFLHISRLNSIPFSKDEVWDGVTVLKNDDNTLSDSYPVKQKYRENVLIQRNDKIKTIQFKSNYEDHVVTIEEMCSDTTINVPVVKKSNNIGRFAKMDATIHKYKTGVAGLYFDDGNTYATDDSIDGTYILNGNLPDFAIVGQFINVEVGGSSIGTYEISDVVFDSSINKRLILFNYPWEQPDENAIVDSTYNLLEFEVYEFDINPAILVENDYRIRLQATEPIFGEANFYSDHILVSDEFERTSIIEYFGKDNKDIFYAYGIKHYLRLEVEHISADIDDNQKITLGDSTASLADSEVYDGNKFMFSEMTRNAFLRTCMALSSPYVFIDNIGYVKKKDFDFDNIDGSNLYELTASMIKTGINSGNVQTPTIGSPTIYIPNVLAGGTGLIKL